MSKVQRVKKRPRKKFKRGNRGGAYSVMNSRGYTTVQRSRFTFLEPHLYVSLKYVDNIAYSMLTGVAQNNVFNLNSIFDPDRTGGGHQPYGFDQLVAMYNRYRVLKVSWVVSVAPVGGNMKLLVLPSNGLVATAITTAATFASAAELPFARWKAVPATGANPITLRGSMELNELNGTTRLEYLADDRFEAQVASSPTELLVLNVAILNDSTGTLTPNPTVQLIFHVDLHDPIILTSSYRENLDKKEEKADQVKALEDKMVEIRKEIEKLMLS